MSRSSARPDDLFAYRTAATGMSDALGTQRDALTDALDAFRSSAGWTEYLADVPPLDIDLGAAGGRLRRLGGFAGQVGTAFVEAGADRDEVGRVDDADLESEITPLADPEVGPLLVRDGDRWIVRGSEDADHISVYVRDGTTYVRRGRLDPATGHLVYEDEVALTRAQAASLVIRTGGENDVIELPAESNVRITVWTGDGDDMVGAPGSSAAVRTGPGGDDRIFAGEGNDTIFGGAGDDEVHLGAGRDYADGEGGDDVIVGGDDFDSIYGGAGDDELLGGRGDDSLEGGSGSDDLDGGRGDDLLSGGRDDDVLTGGAGNDHLFGGRGVDEVDGGRGDDHTTAEEHDDLSYVEDVITIELEGDPGSYAIDLPQPSWMSDAEYESWLEHIDSDLELLRTTEAGRESLEHLDDVAEDSDSGWNPFDRDRRVVIIPYGDDDAPEGYSVEDFLRGDGLPGNYASPPGGSMEHDSVVSAGGAHTRALDDRPPVSSLFHELAHAYDQISGGTPGGDYVEVLRDGDGNEIERRTANRAELNSVGNDLDGDGDPDAAPGDDHPEIFTENALRDDLGLSRRPSYRFSPEDIAEVDGGHVTFEDTD